MYRLEFYGFFYSYLWVACVKRISLSSNKLVNGTLRWNMILATKVVELCRYISTPKPKFLSFFVAQHYDKYVNRWMFCFIHAHWHKTPWITFNRYNFANNDFFLQKMVTFTKFIGKPNSMTKQYRNRDYHIFLFCYHVENKTFNQCCKFLFFSNKY